MAFPLDPEQRFRQKQSSVGKTTSTGKGLGARLRTEASVAKSSSRGSYSEARMENAMADVSTANSQREAEDLDYTLEMEQWISSIQGGTSLSRDTTEETETPEEPTAPAAPTASTPNENFAALAEKLAKSANDPTFISAVKNLAKKYSTTPNKIYGIINGESAWDPTASNAGGYKSLFALGVVASEEAGIDYENLTTMSPSQQVAEYDKYLARWEYDGSVSLGLMQAAPGLAKRLKGSPSSTVVYTKGSPEWDANPGWRSGTDGDITLASIDAYYSKGT